MIERHVLAGIGWLVTTPPRRSSPRARRRPAGSGSTCATTGRSAARILLRRCSTPRAIGRASILSGIWPATPAFCKPTRSMAIAEFIEDQEVEASELIYRKRRLSRNPPFLKISKGTRRVSGASKDIRVPLICCGSVTFRKKCDDPQLAVDATQRNPIRTIRVKVVENQQSLCSQRIMMSASFRSETQDTLTPELRNAATSSAAFDRDLAAEIGTRVAMRRNLCGISTLQLGARLGIDAADVSAYERAKSA
jgi:hypothetical protein